MGVRRVPAGRDWSFREQFRGMRGEYMLTGNGTVSRSCHLFQLQTPRTTLSSCTDDAQHPVRHANSNALLRELCVPPGEGGLEPLLPRNLVELLDCWGLVAHGVLLRL